MSITVKNLIKNAQFLYKMKLISGKNGMDNLVQWVHIIEDEQVSSFLHGNELVFTAGILNKTEEWLLDFAKKLYTAGASAFVVNLGPHTKDIPAAVVNYCDEVQMPLFTIPWETRMVDMTRDFCHKIIKNDSVEDNAATSIKNIIFETGDQEQQIHQLERYGFHRSGKFTFVCITMDSGEYTIEDKTKKILSMNGEKLAKVNRDLFIRFSHKNSLVFVLAEYSDDEVERFVGEFYEAAGRLNQNVYMGVSSNQIGLCNQSKNFEKAFSTMEMAAKRKQQILYYDKMDIFKILFAVREKPVLRNFYHDTIGKLEVYDKENNSNLTEVLKNYLENNGNVQLVSEKMFVHRNTINNHLKKIEKITDKNPLELEDKLLLMIGFNVKDII